MRLIELYILRRIAIMFFAVLGSAVAITWIVQILQRIDFLTTNGQSFYAIVKFGTLLLPAVIPLVMPFALVIAVSQTLSTMNQDSELVVINAAGASRAIVAKPVLMLAIIIAALSFTISSFVDPYSRMAMRTMLAEAGSDVLNVLLQEGSFRKISDNFYVQIAERKPDGRIGGLFIADSREPNVDKIYYSTDAVVANQNGRDVLLMSEGEVQHRDLKSNNVSIIRFDSYSFDISQFMETAGNVSFYAKDRPLTYLMSPDPNDPMLKTRPLAYKAELHERLTEWMYPIVFALIALAVAGDARSHREARFSATVTAISISLVIFWLGNSIAQNASKDASLIKYNYIIPIGAIIFLSYILISGKTLSIPTQWSDSFNNIVDQTTRLFKKLLKNLKLLPRKGERI